MAYYEGKKLTPIVANSIVNQYEFESKEYFITSCHSVDISSYDRAIIFLHHHYCIIILILIASHHIARDRYPNSHRITLLVIVIDIILII